MSSKRYLYEGDDSFTSDDSAGFGYMTDRRHDQNEADDVEEYYEDSELLQDTLYSSSSLDRSSIGSIPWAEDAIKKNQLEWERVERMLSGQEELTDEPELRNEILDWQKKFPQLLNKSKEVVKTLENQHQQQKSSASSTLKMDESIDIDSIANLNLGSLNNDDDDQCDGLATPTNDDHGSCQQKLSHNSALLNRRQIANTALGLATLKMHKHKASVVDKVNIMDRDLRISSVPLTLGRRKQILRKNAQDVFSSDSDNRIDSYSPTFLPPTSPPHNKVPTQFTDLLTNQHAPPSSIALNTNYESRNPNAHMPPILNVLESKKRFHGLVNNRSFVQLTHVHQAKSAAVFSQKRKVGYAVGDNGTAVATGRSHQSMAWDLPLAAATMSSRFPNNRNSIILPAIDMQHNRNNPALTNSDREVISGTTNSSTTSREDVPNCQHINQMLPRAYYQQSRIRMSTTSTSPSTGGRSISAAMHPKSKYEFSAFFMPYSASKFKVFK